MVRRQTQARRNIPAANPDRATHRRAFLASGEIKAHHALSYADAFAAALAIAEDATILTADAEFATLGDRLQRLKI
ncbi:MAG: PIN domain-containing protein [Chromatiales bacterium]|jgi:predicted nucleic acid-binding protein|nr:PIN domain-containing protein [Chromatiales bacterium]MDX9767832.1 PIN domain-containing protein [Ectothiorhodospiraceae bacterium]